MKIGVFFLFNWRLLVMFASVPVAILKLGEDILGQLVWSGREIELLN